MPGRVDGVDLRGTGCAVRLAQQQLALVAVGVVGSSATESGRDGAAKPAGVPSRCGQLELAVGRGERVGLQRVRAVGVALDHLGERVALELGAQVHAGRAGQVVQPVAVLQVLQLRLEDVVERAAQQAAEQVGDLGEAADPQVDVVEPGGGHAVGVVRPGAGAEHEVGGVASGSAGRRRVGRVDDRSAAARLPASVVARR